MYKIISTIVFLLAVTSSFSQDLVVGHSAFYRDGLTPASFMQNNDVNIFALYNNEFSGFDKQPVTQIADISFVLFNRHKIGLSVVNDVVGFDRTQNIKARYAKQFQLYEKTFFSLGLGAGILRKQLEVSSMSFEHANDPLSYSDYSHTSIDIDFGAEFQIDKLFMGVSVTHLNRKFVENNNVNSIAHYYGYAQYIISTNNFRFYPNLLFRYWKNYSWIEGGLILFYKDKVWLGSDISWNFDTKVLAGMRIAKNIHFGYTYRTNMNPNVLSPGTTNSHEIFLNFAFNKERSNIKSVRLLD